MYTVLLIDDEPRILRGLHKTFKWDEMGFEVIAETSDSVKALELIFSLHPDVVFTDIRMPEIDGIELMKRVRAKGLDTEFVVISGFAEFEFAREALKVGALDYVMKPLDRELADQLLHRIVQQLKSKEDSRNYGIFEQIINEEEHLEKSFRKVGVQFSYKYYRVIVVKFDNKLSYQSLEFEHKKDITVFKVKMGTHKYMYIINFDTDIIENLTDMKNSYNGDMNYNLGLSSVSTDISDLQRLVKEADGCTFNNFIYGKNDIYVYRRSENNILKSVIDKLTLFIDKPDYKGTTDYVSNLPVFFKKNQLTMENVVFLWNQIVAIVSKSMDPNASSFEIEFLDYEEIATKYGSIENLCRTINEIILHLTNQVNNLDIYINENFKKMLDYIEDHFSEDLSLKELANIFSINFSYSCVLFKKVTGRTFSEYLTDARMEKAVEFLSDKTLSIAVICFKIGYNDYYYFNKVFKKHYGITPLSYRKIKCK